MAGGGAAELRQPVATLSSTVDALFRYGTWLESRDKELKRDDELPSLKAYRLAAEVLDNLRSRVLSTEEGKILAGERASELTTSLLGLEARSAPGGPFSAKAERLLQDAEGGLARVFLEELAHARAFMLGGVSSEVLVREKAIQADLDRLEQELAAEQALQVANAGPSDRESCSARAIPSRPSSDIPPLAGTDLSHLRESSISDAMHP